jgi:nucleoside-diphosphate kinase
MLEKTFFMIKPDGLARGLAEQILALVEAAGLRVIRKKKIMMSGEQAADLYSPHLGQNFYPGLVRYMTSGEVLCVEVEGEAAVARLRTLMGATDPERALAGTIRGDLKEKETATPEGTIKNLVHGSDSPASAKRELGIFFK